MTQLSEPDRQAAVAGPPVYRGAVDPIGTDQHPTGELDQLAADAQTWTALSPAAALEKLTAAHSQLQAALSGLDRV